MRVKRIAGQKWVILSGLKMDFSHDYLFIYLFILRKQHVFAI